MSGITNRMLPPNSSYSSPGIAFLIGLIISIPVYVFVTGNYPEQAISPNMLLLGVAGLLVGFGSTMGNGCTSGHGVCGMSLLSVRSIVATCVFMFTAFVTVFVLRHVVGG